MSRLTASELMAWGLANLWKEVREGGYAVRHGRQPVNDFHNRGQPGDDTENRADLKLPNFFEQAFPILYPYGEGGIEGNQGTPIDFSKHVKWSL